MPRPVRSLDGFLIGLGGARLAWEIWREGAAVGRTPVDRTPRALEPGEADGMA